jgi:SAM-dependent methyltransferase
MTPPHLGGHLGRTHVDYGTFDYIKLKFKIHSMLDVGCGPGGMVDYAKTHDVTACGIDGDPEVNPTFLHDYTTGPFKGHWDIDLVWSVEFLEHVEERFLPNVLETFKFGKYVILTHALPGDIDGHHHVNLQTEDYWRGVLAGIGFQYDEAETKVIREVSTMTKGFMKKTGKFFRRYD